MKKKLIILGCGSSVGVPRIDGFWGKCDKKNKKNIRSRCSALIIKGKNSVLIDTSPDLKYQLLSNKIKDISSVIITHEHADQTNGLFELRPFFWKYKKKINIYANSQTIKLLKKRHDFCFNESREYPAITKATSINSQFTLGNNNEKIKFNTLQVTHGKIMNTAYIFEKTAYIADCNDLNIIKKKILKKLNYLVLDCLKFNKHPSHFNFTDAIFVHKKLQPKKTILTNLHTDIDYSTLKRKLPENIIPAHDGLTLNL